MDKSNSNKMKTWAEIFLMPIVIAIVGGIATFVVAYFQTQSTTEIKKSQIESAERISAAERDSAEKKFRAEQQVKILEIFGERFFSDNAKEKELAVKMLAAVDPRLALFPRIQKNQSRYEPPRV